MPDFYIGAHAAVAGYRLLTRDVQRYRTYFQAIDIIAPTTT
jgi:predicted nucleic acid-binding protein